MNRPTKEKKNEDKGGTDHNLEQEVFKALVQQGHIFPETEAEVQSVEESVAGTMQPLPERLRDTRKVLAQIKNKAVSHSEKVISLPKSHFAEAAIELARAARKGAEIPLSIEEKMRRNRARADAEDHRKLKAK